MKMREKPLPSNEVQIRFNQVRNKARKVILHIRKVLPKCNGDTDAWLLEKTVWPTLNALIDMVGAARHNSDFNAYEAQIGRISDRVDEITRKHAEPTAPIAETIQK